MMIPANPGGGWDQTGRNLAAAMQSAKLVSSVQFDNKGGAGGTIGLAQFINSAKGDPNALMIGGMVMVGAIYLEQFAGQSHHGDAVARLTGEYEVIVVPASSPHKNMADLVKAFKANPGGVSWGGGSAGGTDHILVGLIAKATGVDPSKINYVPFKGGGEAIAAIVGGHVTAGVSGIGEFAEQIKGGRMRALAVSSPTKIEGYPDAEGTGHRRRARQLARHLWRAGHHDAAARRAGQDHPQARPNPRPGKRLWKSSAGRRSFLSGDAFKKFIDEDTKRIAGIIDSLGIKNK